MKTREQKKNFVDDNNAHSSIRKRGRPGKRGSQIKNDIEVVEKDFAEGTPIILSSGCKKLRGSSARKAGLNYDEECMKLDVDQKKQPDNLPIHEQECPGGSKTHRRKRGRPQKVLVSRLIAAMTGQNADVAEENFVVEDSSMCEVNPLIAADTPAELSMLPYSDCKKRTDYPSNQKNVSVNTFNTTSAKMSFSNGEGSESQHDTQILKKTYRRTSGRKGSSQTQDTTMVKMVESVCINTKEAKMGLKPGCNMSDDQPLSKWVEEMQSSGSPAVAKQHTESMTVKELSNQTPDNNNGTLIASDEVATQGPAVGTQTLSVVCEPELPFEKNTSLWAVVESMEVFRKIPQKPHFRPLLSFKESSREGFALACMVNFCSAVESISRLQFDDPNEKMDDILDTLNDLETHGFSVQALRDRIRELVSIKENHGQLCAEVDDYTKEVILSFLDTYERDNEIHEIGTDMERLKERMAKLKSMKKIKDQEIAALESRRQDVEEAMKRTRSCYEELAAAS